jgi:RimJ/RimL family protein N-acetyltransferase
MRILFKFEPSHAALPLDWRETVPSGFAVRRIDRSLAEELQATLLAHGNPPWFEEIWGGIDRFLTDGFGFVAIGPEGIASNCRSSSVSNGVGEIQVSTRSYGRQKGLATLVCRAFIEHCLISGLTPGYACDEDNLASIGLAHKLGFVPRES